MIRPAGPKRRVLIVANAFVPGFRGGSIRTLDHLTKRLGADFDFYVCTRNHDYTNRVPYDLPLAAWLDGGDAVVRYERPWRRTPRRIAAFAEEIDADVLFVNSLFATGPIAAVVARRFGLISLPLIIAPEGELGPVSRRQRRSAFKAMFLAVMKRVGCYRDATWRAASDDEARDIAAFVGRPTRIVTAASLPPLPVAPPAEAEPGPTGPADAARPLRLIYLSAIDGRKGAVRSAELVLRTPDATIDFYGPVRDRAEHAALMAVAATDPSGRVRVHEAIEHGATHELLAGHDALIFPTGEEVLGYVVGEALLAGCPVLVSDRTPWTDLDEWGAGRVIALDDDDAWLAAIAELAGRSPAQRAAMRDAAVRRGRQWASDDSSTNDWRTLFDLAVTPR